MGKSHNEQHFKKIIKEHTNIKLSGKKIFKNNETKVEISVDETVEDKDYHFLIEIDSGNQAKLIVGQYCLLNQLYKKNEKKPFFIVVHYYKNYNPKRTIKNLKFINETQYNGKGIPFVIFNNEELLDFLIRNKNNSKKIRNKLLDLAE